LEEKLGLKVMVSRIIMKTINSKAKAMIGLAAYLLVQINGWKRLFDFTMISMDDFEVILGQYFMRGN